MPESVPGPDENARVQWRGCDLTLEFYPAINLTRPAGYEFAAQQSASLEINDVRAESTHWNLLGSSGIEIKVFPQSISLSAPNALHPLESYEQKIRSVLESFSAIFEPGIALRSRALVFGLLPLPDDAMSFLSAYIMAIDPKRFDAIGRTPEILGLRFFLPTAETGEIDWSVSVRVESSFEKAEMLYLEADAAWDSQEAWDGGFAENAVKKLSTVSDFVSEKLVNFLREPSQEDTDDA